MPRCLLASESPRPTRIHNGMFQRPEHFLPHLLFLLLTALYIYIKAKAKKKEEKKTHFYKVFYKQIWRVREGLKKPLKKSGCKMFKKKKENFSCRNTHWYIFKV